MKRSKRPLVTHECNWCGIEFKSRSATVKFHDAACRLKYFRYKSGSRKAFDAAFECIEALAKMVLHPETEDEAIEALTHLKNAINTALLEDEEPMSE